jgi:adenylate cyclase
LVGVSGEGRPLAVRQRIGDASGRPGPGLRAGRAAGRPRGARARGARTAAGAPARQLAAAAAEDRLALLPVDRLLGGVHSAAEIERLTGTPAALLLRIRRLLGLPRAGPQDRVFGVEDVEAARATGRFLAAGLSESALVEITRVLGEAMSRLAATTAGAFADSFLRPGDSEDAVAVRFAQLAEELLPALGPVLAAAFAAHLRESVSRGMITRAELERGQLSDSQQLVVCFADLVGFTRLGGELEAQQLGIVADRLAQRAAEVAEPPVRLVKTIGDAAMFVCGEPAPLLVAVLRLIELAEEDELPSLRAGVAVGGALARAGDYFGHAVNLSSRVTGVARPGSVLATEQVREAAGDAVQWSFAGRFRLKGLSQPLALHRARLPGPFRGAPVSSSPRP